LAFPTDSVVSGDLSSSGCVDSSAATICSTRVGDSTCAQQQGLDELVNSYTFEPTAVDFGVNHDSAVVKGGGVSDSWVESLLCGYSASTSPSSSSGCESDFSLFADEPMSYSDDNGLFDSYDDQFNDLFPELF